MKTSTLKSLFRFLGFLEGGSLLFLIGVGMPLKYFLNRPDIVQTVGPVHGLLFTLYVIMLIWMTIRVKWTKEWTIAGFIAALIPFGTFVYDYYFLKSNYY